MPLSANRVQKTVHRIISVISGIRLQQGPCPGIALLFPVFSAGCAAIENTYREKVLALMREMAGLYGIMNVRHCMKILETLLSRQIGTEKRSMDFRGETSLVCRQIVLSRLLLTISDIAEIGCSRRNPRYYYILAV